MSDGQDYSTIRVERVSRVERITLNRPEKRNALSFELRDELVGEILRAERSDDVRCIVIRARAPRSAPATTSHLGARIVTGPR